MGLNNSDKEKPSKGGDKTGKGQGFKSRLPFIDPTINSIGPNSSTAKAASAIPFEVEKKKNDKKD